MAAGGTITIADIYTEAGYVKVTWWDGTTNVISSGSGYSTSKVAIGGTRTITIHSCVANGTNSGKIIKWYGAGTDLKLTSIDATGCIGMDYFDKYNESVLTSFNVSGCTSLATASIFSCALLTSINVAGCTSLATLNAIVNATLASLDVTGLNALKNIDARYNNMNATALNACFNTLNTTAGTKLIDVSGNPGSATCNPALATAKGWTVTR